MKKEIFLLFPYYWPHYRAGGPVQSLFNLARTLQDHTQVFLVSHQSDIDNSSSDQHIEINQWNSGVNNEKIFYAKTISLGLIFRLFREIKPELVLINGIFNASTTIPGILASRWFNCRMIISPRGMLQEWGLQRGKLKKLVFLKLLKLFLSKHEEWHATDEQERTDILKIFGEGQVVHVAPNIPRQVSPLAGLSLAKPEEKIKLVFLSLINPNKNLHFIIDAVKQNQKYVLDIYGPVANESYWKICQKKMEGVQSIRYLGAVPPWNITEVLKNYHFFVLPTQGENFGHAIFDSLASSVPVIISRNTPWKDIDAKGAGIYMNENSEKDLVSILNYLSTLTDTDYQNYRTDAHNYALQFWTSGDYLKDYRFLLDKNDSFDFLNNDHPRP